MIHSLPMNQLTKVTQTLLIRQNLRLNILFKTSFESSRATSIKLTTFYLPIFLLYLCTANTASVMTMNVLSMKHVP